MPERREVVTFLTERVVGTHVWDGRTGEPQTIPADRWDATRDAADELWERIVAQVNWNRILIEATSRHLNIHPDLPGAALNEGPCGNCVREALLRGEDGQWANRTTHPDWPVVFAEHIRYRRSGTTL
jgi:hypothetical protein